MATTSSTSVATALASGVARGGADTVFGLPGGGPNLDVVGAAQAAGLRFVLTHGETEACMMAATYGLLTGRPALAIATRGPGAACAANGAAQATLDRFPLLLVTDCVPTPDRARYGHQRMDQQQMLGAATKWSGRLAVDGADGTVRAALALAAARPAGAVHLDYDPDGETIDVPTVTAVGCSSESVVERASAMVNEANRPVAIVGLEAAGSSAASVLSALERLGCPILTTYQAMGVVPEGHPQQAGLYTSGVIEAAVIQQADLVIAVGLDQVEPMPFPWRYDVPVVSVSEVPASSTLVPITVEVLGPLETTLSRVLGEVGPREWPADAGSTFLAAARASLAGTSAGGFGPLELMQAARGAAPAGTTVTVDAGAHFLAIMPFWPATRPFDVLISNGLATMGFAVPAAVGAALARPDRPVLCFVGDGGLAMTVAELETIVRLRLPVTVVVFDDAALSLIEIKQRAGQGGAGAVRFGVIDYAGVARAMGMDAVTVTSAAEAESALHGGWDRPRLIDARIDPATYPQLMRVTRG